MHRVLDLVLASCPDCAPARATRAAVTGDPDLYLNLLAVLAPFLVLAFIAGLLHRKSFL